MNINFNMKNIVNNIITGIIIGLFITTGLKLYLLKLNKEKDNTFITLLNNNNNINNNKPLFIEITDKFFNKYLNIVEKKKTVIKKKKTDDNLKYIKSFKLKGIYTGSGDDFVIIEYKGIDNFVNKGNKFHGFLLKKIGYDYIILEKNNKEYKIYLLDSNKKEKYKILTSNNNNIEIINKTSINNKGNKPPNVKKIIKPIEISRIEKLNKISRKKLINIKNNLKYIWKNIGIKKTEDGYKITYINYNSIFGKLGLKPGDKILSVNGQDITSDADAWNIYKNIGKFNTVRLRVKTRDGRIKYLMFQITN